MDLSVAATKKSTVDRSKLSVISILGIAVCHEVTSIRAEAVSDESHFWQQCDYILLLLR
jgi:hypothetical protein